MWIDSHCHLDAQAFDADRSEVFERAKKAGIQCMLIPAVTPQSFHQLIELAHEYKQPYALGIHPLWMNKSMNEEYVQQSLRQVSDAVTEHQNDPYFVAIGEIGLDGFVHGFNIELQWHLYIEQLKLAKRFNIPVILHVRHSNDLVLKGLRQVGIFQGIAHAFNGSEQQAQQFIQHGFKLGFGGAATFDRAKQIRRLLKALPLNAIVLETDAPDMPPRWIYKTAQQRQNNEEQGRNEPAELALIAKEIATLCSISEDEFSRRTVTNTVQAIPKLESFLTI